MDQDGALMSNLEIESRVPLVPAIAQSAMALAPFPLPKIPVKVSQCWIFKPGAGDIPTFPAVSFQVFALDVHDVFVQMLKRVDPVCAEKIPATRDEVVAARGVERVVQAIRDIFLEKPSVYLRNYGLRSVGATLSAMDSKKRQDPSNRFIMMYHGGNSRYLDFYGPPGTVDTIPILSTDPLCRNNLLLTETTLI